MALPKLFQRIFWTNNTTPAINASNLNAISKGLDDLDDRVISLAGTIMEDVPALEDLTDRLEAMTENPPYIGASGNWYVWDTNTGAYVDSGVDASITITVGTVTTLPAGSDATVTNVGTSTDPIFNFGIPQGAAGTGDMNASTYDPNGTVATAGGIVAYIDSTITAALTASY